MSRVLVGDPSGLVDSISFEGNKLVLVEPPVGIREVLPMDPLETVSNAAQKVIVQGLVYGVVVCIDD